MPPLRILILSDGRPGHFNLSEGIAAAIERLCPAVTTRHEVRRGRWPGAVLAALTRSRLPPRSMLATVHGTSEADIPPCDVIVSAGAETLAASVWLGRARGIPNIFYGSLRLYDPHDFALVLTSYARNADKPNHVRALKPSRLDPDSLRPPSPPDRQRAPIMALLVGGDAGPIRFTPADWQRLTALVEDMARIHGVRWLIANSRRTPLEFGDIVAKMAERRPSPIEQFLDVRSAGPGTLPALLERCDVALCTADSSSMISECIWTRRPTLSLAPANCPFTEDEQEYRSWLSHSGWCRQISLAGATPDTIQDALEAVTPLHLNPQVQLADLLQRHLPALAKTAASHRIGQMPT